jgi:nucleoside-diphosphate-sugar epimerase
VRLRLKLTAGHDVTGLARSDASAAALQAKGAHVRRGDLDDLDSIRAGAVDAEAVIHLANKHDFSNPAASNVAERSAVQTIGDTLVDTSRPFLFASGVAGLAQGRPATENDASSAHGPDSPRGGAENLAFEFAECGVRSVSLRIAPTVHGTGDHGFIATIAGIAREKGVSGYPSEGPTVGPPCTDSTPGASSPSASASASKRLPQVRACTPSANRACPPAR